MSIVSSVSSLVLDLPPSCIEFAPSKLGYFVVGTYNLEKSVDGSSQQGRNGSLILFRMSGDQIVHVQTVKTASAVLDLHFHQHITLRDLLGVATSTGSISLFRLLTDTVDKFHLEHFRTLQLFDPSILVLSLAWCKDLPFELGASLSNGEVFVVEDEWLANETKVEAFSRKRLITRHEREAWTVAVTPHGRGVFSGGDDMALWFCSFCCTQPSSITSILEPASLSSVLESAHPDQTWSDRKLHSAGITAILPLSDHVLVTGSYDDCIRVILAPTYGRPTVLKELNLGGGVWRLKLMKQRPEDWQEGDQGPANFLILASCMHAGTRIIRLALSENGDWDITILAQFEEHKSMNYGSDFRPETKGDSWTIVSTSFYDKLLCMWHFDG